MAFIYLLFFLRGIAFRIKAVVLEEPPAVLKVCIPQLKSQNSFHEKVTIIQSQGNKQRERESKTICVLLVAVQRSGKTIQSQMFTGGERGRAAQGIP